MIINYRKDKEIETNLNIKLNEEVKENENENEDNKNKKEEHTNNILNENKEIIDGLFIEKLPQYEKNLIRWYMLDLYGKQYVKLLNDVQAELKIWINSMY